MKPHIMIKKLIKNIVPHSTWQRMRRCLKPSLFVRNWSDEKQIASCLDLYEKCHGYRFDITHPELFTEKVHWMKYFYHDERIPKLTNKVTFKDYVREKLGEGHTIPMLGHWKSAREFKKFWRPENLPDRFCVKSSTWSDGYGILFVKDKTQCDFKEAFNVLKTWYDPINSCQNGLSWRYYDQPIELLIEEFLEQDGHYLNDYKVFCFDGKPYCLYVEQDNFSGHGCAITFYDLDWNKLDVQYGDNPTPDAVKPKHYEQMLEYARVLSQGFAFVRVDFFDTEDKLYVAEMTFDPGGGFTPFYPKSFNKELGDKFLLPKSNIYRK